MSNTEHRLAGGTFGVLMKWAAVAVAVILLGFNLINFLQYKRIEPILSEKIADGQALETRAIAEAIRPARVRSMAVDSSGIYAALLAEQIDRYAEDGSFASITILDTLGNIVHSTQRAYARGDFYPYIESDRMAFNTALGGATSGGELYRVGGRQFRGTYAPIADELGATRWVLAVEAGAEYYEVLALLRRNLLIFAILSIVVAIAGGAILLSTMMILRRMERRILNISKMATMGQMAAGVAHDLRNPLSIIRASAERLAKSSPERREGLVESIVEEVARIDGTVEEYLAMARPHSKDESVFSLGGLAEEVAGSFFAGDGHKATTLKASWEGNAKISAPAGAIRRAIINILANAVEALPDGGTIRIRSLDEGTRVLLVIEDDGKGVSRKQAARIFEPFFTTKPEGTGIGLTLAKKIIEDAGGELCLKKSELGGCAFEIAFPKAEV
ncbi:MAG TPA: HAMP domain-containing histidine kinase [candidate division Zixibacteria bacterium]|nr:HAMP domain-containing histidine kinase [candidate division Zixibacteria bacterium]